LELLWAAWACAALLASWPYLAAAAEPADGAPPARANRLASETSPYLLLHAHNPVDWFPWGEEALAKARAEGKPIFLSIGYSSCHWCHVMERESFMDDEIADFLNEHFVSIKVDREERPDIDEIYMTAVQAYFEAVGAAQGGGWPLSMFLTPDGLPIVGGTYFPPRDTDQGTGFLTVLGRVEAAWQRDREGMEGQAEQLAELTRRYLSRRPIVAVRWKDEDVYAAAVESLADDFDPEHGGFGYSEATSRRPKFPQAPELLFLADRARREDSEQARRMLVETLDAMAAGGIRDHLGGGFHRYSTDRFWRIPHFEKMLYDQGLLLSAFAEAYALTGDESHRQVVEEMVAFVNRELRDKSGGYYAALDADTEHGEGAYYSWEPGEVRGVLGVGYNLYSAVYGLEGEPNFEERYLPLLARPWREVAEEMGLEADSASAELVASRAALLEQRSQRPAPALDSKIMADWNGLAIRGLADAGRLLEEPSYVADAARAAECVLANLRTPEGRLLHTFTAGQAKLNAYLDDYAFLIDGLIALHQATGEQRWLDEAAELTDAQISLFWDAEHGGFFFTSDDHEKLLARIKDPVDSATPSGNGVSARNLAYLGAALEREEYLDRAEETIDAFAALWSQAPAAMPTLAEALAALRDARGAEEPEPADQGGSDRE
jgi:uncharacterized protein YyaL (SSP411 family)